nr:MAG TPA: hypothetical protein [Caudoviricetes sp.]
MRSISCSSLVKQASSIKVSTIFLVQHICFAIIFPPN